MSSILAYQSDRPRPCVPRAVDGPRTLEEIIEGWKERRARAAALRPPIALPMVTAQLLKSPFADISKRQIREARETLAKIKKPYPTVRQIIAEASRFFLISQLDIVSHRRTKNVVRPRQIVMYIARTITPLSLPEIGRQLGGRDHTTCLHGILKIERLCASDPMLAAEVAAIKAKLMPAENAG